ncbi:MAG TPA: NAD(P)/FAD-dependent oxidoreductase [Burkholderiales bacterium]|nr:NAD(P)/FAD-dependent oxidoreductase [Burkholderiales bacterium]
MSADVVIIGAGADELVCAHYLARDGHRVQVLEERTPDAHSDGDPGWIPSRVIHDLGLARHGLAIRRADPWVAAPLPDGGSLQLWADIPRSVDAIRRLSPRDAAKWPAFCRRMAQLACLLQGVYAAPPPDLLSSAPAELARLAGRALRLRALGRRGMEDFLRLLPMSAADWLDDWFECPELKAVLGATAILHYRGGPRADGTGFRMLHHHVGSPAGVFGTAFSNLRSVLSRLPGVRIRGGAAVARITVRAGQVTGVVLAGGEEIAATRVVSGAGPRRTLLGLVDADWLDPDLARAVQHIRCRGVVARLVLALERELPHPTLHVAPSLDYLERASDEAKHGRVSQAPYLQARSAGRTADGRHRVEVHMQYAPYALADGPWNDDRRAALGLQAVQAFSRHWPDLGAVAVERVLAPPDLELMEGWPEGQAHHAELALDQALWMRPLPGWARYRAPVGGLYLCGAGTHPGGGAAGAAGANAARVIREERPRRAGA